MRAPTEKHNVGALLDQLTKKTSQATGVIECVSLQEALAENLVSFPRRLALHLYRQPEHLLFDPTSNWDDSLVRHLYDIHEIKNSARYYDIDKQLLAQNLA